MKFEFHAEMGINGCSEDEVVEIPDEDLAGDDREEVIRRYFEDRERYVMQGHRGALEGARILRDALLDTEKDEKDISNS